MKVYVDRTRMAMSGRFYAFDVRVLRQDAPHVPQCEATTIVKSTPWREFYNFVDATLPASHFAMERGLPRYEAYLAHEKQAQTQALELIKRAFPEAAGLTKFPLLWVELPEFEGTHATEVVEWPQ